jgi:uracil phosphoribosyltransferase
VSEGPRAGCARARDRTLSRIRIARAHPPPSLPPLLPPPSVTIRRAPLLLAARRVCIAACAFGGATAWTTASTPSPLPSPPSPTPPSPHRYPSEYQRLHPNLVVVESRALKSLFTALRDESTLHLDFATHADRLMTLLAEEGLAHLPGVVPTTVTTPCGVYHGLKAVPAHQVVAVSIVRAGDTLLEAVRRVEPGVAVGKILIQRDEADQEKLPRLFFCKVPHDIKGRTVLLVDPMLATGQSASVAIEQLLLRGVPAERIVFLNVVSCPEGLAVLGSRYPAVKVVTAAVDEGLNQQLYIVPGLGDFGDRYYGTTD